MCAAIKTCTPSRTSARRGPDFDLFILVVWPLALQSETALPEGMQPG